MSFDPVAKILIFVGATAIGLGLLWQTGWIQSSGLGRLPGDFIFEKENYRIYFPLVTCLVLSALLSLILWALRRF